MRLEKILALIAIAALVTNAAKNESAWASANLALLPRPHLKTRRNVALNSQRNTLTTNDRDDVIFLLRLLKITSPEVVFNLIDGYYPKNRIPPKTRFFIEEVLEPAD